ncbi:MAG TPA: hypothetical protein V6D17_12415 [Candidatus Obscuribacterales bacterium]
MSEPAHAKNESPKEDRLELAVRLLLITVIALLAANVLVLAVGSFYNDRACQNMLRLAARARMEGRDQRAIMRAAFNELTMYGDGGYFVQHPQCTQFIMQNTGTESILQVQTATNVRLPAPIFVAEGLKDNGCIVLYKTYKSTFKNGSSSTE